MAKNLTDLKIRPAAIDDLPELQTLYVDTIRSTCRNDYDQNQINAWASTMGNQAGWLDALVKQYFLIALINHKIVGFGSLENGDYLDFLYVHKNFLRQGIANKLYRELEKESLRLGSEYITSDVSKTAKPFFEANGFNVVKENKNRINSVEIINYRMIKYHTVG